MDEFYEGEEEYDEEFEGDEMEGEEEDYGDEGDDGDMGGMAGLQQLLRGGMGGGGQKEGAKQALKHGLIRQNFNGLFNFKKSEFLLAGTGFLLMFKGAAWQPIVIGGLLTRWMVRRGKVNASTRRWRGVQRDLLDELAEPTIVFDTDPSRLIAASEKAVQRDYWRPKLVPWLREYNDTVAMYNQLVAHLEEAEQKGTELKLDAELARKLTAFQESNGALLAAVRGEPAVAVEEEGQEGAEEGEKAADEEKPMDAEDAIQRLNVLLGLHAYQQQLVPEEVKPDMLDRFVHKLTTTVQRSTARLLHSADAWEQDSSYIQGLSVTDEEAWDDFLQYRAKKAAAAPQQPMGGFPGMGGMGGFPGMGGMGGMGGLQQLLAGLGRR